MSKILTIARVFVHQDGEGTFPKWEHGKILSSFNEHRKTRSRFFRPPKN